MLSLQVEHGISKDPASFNAVAWRQGLLHSRAKVITCYSRQGNFLAAEWLGHTECDGHS